MLIDFSRLEAFADGDKAVEGELYGLFLRVAEGYLETLSNSLEHGDAWSASAHALKGAASNVGAVAMAELAAAVEKAAPSEAQLAALQTLYGATRRTIMRHLC